MSSPLSLARARRLAVIVGDVRSRLLRACAEMPAADFVELVERIAAVQLKYEGDLFLTGRAFT
jgi:hypothetical protein